MNIEVTDGKVVNHRCPIPDGVMGAHHFRFTVGDRDAMPGFFCVRCLLWLSDADALLYRQALESAREPNTIYHEPRQS